MKSSSDKIVKAMVENKENSSPSTITQSLFIKSALLTCIIAVLIALYVSNVPHTFINPFVSSVFVALPSSSTMNTTIWYYALSTFGMYQSKSPIVNTNLGSVQGIISSSRGGRDFFEYRGIPYAKALRFEAPIPAEPWDGLRQANEWGSPCLQFDAMLRGIVLGEEDCLFLNVFTANTKPDKLQPVLVYIHGGGFTGGESTFFNPKYFMDENIENVVVVTINYRLGSLGFLNTGDELIRGNMGLKDQSMALRWIRDNIISFGGDKQQVTLFGESAGGASTHYHVISPLSRGLFQRAIIQSGNVACPWAFTRNPQHQALRFGKLLNCSIDNTTVLVDCLKKMDPKEIVKQHAIIMSPVHLQDDFFPGSVEAVQREDTFLGENPFEMLKRGDFAHIPVIFGVNSAEGALKTARLEAYPEVLEELNEKWNEYIPVLMHYDPNRTDVSDKIRAHYFTKETNGLLQTSKPSQDLETLTTMLSDGLFFEPNHRVAKYHSKFAPTYVYYYTYQSSVLPSMYAFIRAGQPKHWFHWSANVVSSVGSFYVDKYLLTSEDPRRFGACHAEDILQVWSFNPVTDIRPSWSDYPFSKAIVGSFTQFAKHKPNLKFGNVTWPAISSDDTKIHKYMKMDKKGEVIDEPFQKGVSFIESLGIRDPSEKFNW